jgi:opacity protein-like surface antigen
MKKLLYTFTLILGLLVVNQQSAHAQADFGIRGGVNFATISADGFSPDSRTGLLVGAYANFGMDGAISIQPEVLYSAKGASFGDNETKLDYVEIPILAKYTIDTDGSLAPHFYAGPYVGINVSAKNENDDDISEGISSTDFGLTLGGGLGFDSFNIGARYSLGLSNIADADNAGDSKNRVFSIVAGFDF